jgi:8-oxo-dGTP diphosphatase
MSEEKLWVAAGAIITRGGKVLLGRKVEDEEHPLGGQWHFPGGYLEKGENPEKALKREVKEETGLEVEIEKLVEVDYSGDVEPGVDNLIRILYHVEAESGEPEARDDLEEVKWVDRKDVLEEIGRVDTAYIEKSERTKKFLENLSSVEVDTKGVKAVARNSDGKFLLLKRNKEKKEHPGIWEFPGGGLEDESPIEGALRELKEETGLEGEILKGGGTFVWHSEFTDRDIRSYCFLVDADGEVDLSDEHVDFEWVELGEISEKEHFKHIDKDLEAAGVEHD